MKITVDIHTTNKIFSFTVQPKHLFKLESADHLWIPFLDQPQSYIAVFEMINFRVHNILVTKWTYGIGPDNIIAFNEELEFLSTKI